MHRQSTSLWCHGRNKGVTNANKHERPDAVQIVNSTARHGDIGMQRYFTDTISQVCLLYGMPLMIG